MASAFFEDLWNSIFTPGPTNTLLVATNVTFACLVFVLLVLLVATRSLHFLVLLFLSSGLWISINWFSNEVKAASEELRRKEADQRQRTNTAIAENEADDEDGGDDTETEAEVSNMGIRPIRTGSTLQPETAASSAVFDTASSTQLRSVSASQGRLAPSDDSSGIKRKSLSDSVSERSTDSEWEKVE